ncbi:MAG: DNA topology modulation protein [Gammaproteobacteria bacterium]|jgi:adenylate kinase family enzyme|nr:topology modulation protein [Gammaproteobacteria bacterium]MDP6094671.1 DNA topology modulation protein [Gammaproteobacteria bacterium]MDP7455626.1 DNA topology modulation protein [Gammaproteobacteria bacterium]
MNKIAVIGCGGSGKSCFSQELGRRLAIPVHHLDRIFWQPNWNPMDKSKFLDAQQQIFTTDSWIIDGNYGGTMQPRLAAADAIIFLDLSTLSCLWGVIKRYFKYRNKTRPDMGTGNKERLTLEFIHWILFYRSTRRPKIITKLDDYSKSKQVTVLSSRQAVDQFIEATS